MHATADDFVTVAEAAAMLRVAPSTIRRWIRQGDVPAYRIGPRRVALKRAELASLVAPTLPNGSRRGEPRASEWVPRRLTPDEQQRALAALERAQQLSREILARNGGRLFSSSVDTIHEMRAERMRQLTERQE